MQARINEFRDWRAYKIRQAAKNKGNDQNVQWRSGFVISDALVRFDHEEARINEPRHEKTNILHMRKQRRRSASR